MRTKELSSEYQKLFKQTALDYVKEIKQDKHLQNKKYVLFYPTIGKDYFKSRELLIIGRANNGWPNSWTCKKFDKKVIKKSIDESQPNKGECAFEWLNKYKGKDVFSKMVRKKPFWNTTYNLIREHYRRNHEDWTHMIAWSNLYKIAPKDGGNPNRKIEWQSQQKNCEKLFSQEIKELRPENVIMITDLDWVCWEKDVCFIENNKLKKFPKNKYVKATGNINGSNIIITSRPDQRKSGFSQDGFVKEIIKHLK